MPTVVFKNTAIYFLVNLFSQAAVFVLWIIIARVLSPADIGMYSLVIFIVDFFGAFALFGLQSAITRFYYSEEKKETVFFNALAMVVMANVFSFVLLFSTASFISRLLPEISGILNKELWLFFTLIAFSSLYSFGLSHYAASKKVLWYAAISVLQTISFFIFSLLLLFFHFKILGILIALSISYAASALFFAMKEIKNLSFGFFSFSIAKSLLHYAFPMMLYAIFGTIVAYAGRIFLDKYTSLSILGVYSFFLIITLQVNAVWATFNKSWTPEIFSMLQKDKERALKSIEFVAFFATFMYLLFFAVVIIVKNLGLFALFLKPIYISNMPIFYLLLLGPLFIGIYTAAYPLYYYDKKTNIVLLLSISLNMIDMLLTFFMVKNFSQIGAALAYAISSALSMFVFLLAFRKTMKIPGEIIIFSIALFLGMVLGTYILLKTSSEMIFLAIIILCIIFTYYYGQIYKKKHLLQELFKDIKNKFIFSRN